MRSAERIDLVISMIDRTLDEYDRALSVDVPSRDTATPTKQDSRIPSWRPTSLAS